MVSAPHSLSREHLKLMKSKQAPIAYLYSTETHFPSDIGQQLVHTTPLVNNATITGAPDPITLDNVNDLNALAGNNTVYLTSDEGIEAQPSWFNGVRPDSSGVVHGAYTCAGVVAEKTGGITDVFYFYFYAYNEGNMINILGEINVGEFGDHVGDW